MGLFDPETDLLESLKRVALTVEGPFVIASTRQQETALVVALDGEEAQRLRQWLSRQRVGGGGKATHLILTPEAAGQGADAVLATVTEPLPEPLPEPVSDLLLDDPDVEQQCYAFLEPGTGAVAGFVMGYYLEDHASLHHGTVYIAVTDTLSTDLGAPYAQQTDRAQVSCVCPDCAKRRFRYARFFREPTPHFIYASALVRQPWHSASKHAAQPYSPRLDLTVEPWEPEGARVLLEEVQARNAAAKEAARALAVERKATKERNLAWAASARLPTDLLATMPLCSACGSPARRMDCAEGRAFACPRRRNVEEWEAAQEQKL